MINIFLFSFLLSVDVSISTFAFLAVVPLGTAGIKLISQSSRKR